jgi:hypothetical protein
MGFPSGSSPMADEARLAEPVELAWAGQQQQGRRIKPAWEELLTLGRPLRAVV